MHQVEECQYGGQNSADEFDQTGAHQVAHTFNIAHDARYQIAGPILIVISDGEQAHMALYLSAHVCNQALAGL